MQINNWALLIPFQKSKGWRISARKAIRRRAPPQLSTTELVEAQNVLAKRIRTNH
jgi:hypothetical protein